MSSSTHILYVDDDRDSFEMLDFMLRRENEGYSMISAKTAEEALKFIENQQFDLYILDSWLPGGKGTELCRKIREEYEDTPVIFLSAMARRIDRENAFSAGANAYFTKPIDLSEFILAVKNLLDKSSMKCS